MVSLAMFQSQLNSLKKSVRMSQLRSSRSTIKMKLLCFLKTADPQTVKRVCALENPRNLRKQCIRGKQYQSLDFKQR